MKTTHTPGPWAVRLNAHTSPTIVSDHDEEIAAVLTITDDGGPELANAHLIAAAPAMLSALEELFEHCAMVHKHWGENSNSRQADEAQKAARAAIAKAKGEA